MAEVEGTNHNLDDPINISHDSLHDGPTNINDMTDKRITPLEDPQDVGERIQWASDHIDQISNEGTEYSSETAATDDNSTYIPSDDSD